VAPHQFAAARALGLNELRWMNHVLDLETLRPLTDTESAETRALLKDRFGGDLFVFLASRHAWRRRDLTDYKGTDVALRALAAVRDRLPGKLRILLVEKGWDVDATRQLVRDLNLEGQVAWLAPMPLQRLRLFYGAADVVLDQFGVGILALVAVEAMACGAAVLTKLPAFVGAPFYSEPPAFAAVASEGDLVERLVSLLSSPQKRRRAGELGAAWARKNCQWEVGISQLLDIVSEMAGASR
jgi:glycosyltransferase involved in cell wall biosynthesis